MEREHVSYMMWRNLCGCPPSKVKDGNTVAIDLTQHDTQAVVFISNSVVQRGILGSFISSLENRQLKSVQMLFSAPNNELLTKFLSQHRLPMSILDSHSHSPCVISLWKGEDLFRRISESAKAFGNNYALKKYDIIWSEDLAHAKKDVPLWFPAPSSSTVAIEQKQTVINGEIVANEEEAEKKTEEGGEVKPVVVPKETREIPEVQEIVYDTERAETVEDMQIEEIEANGEDLPKAPDADTTLEEIQPAERVKDGEERADI